MLKKMHKMKTLTNEEIIIIAKTLLTGIKWLYLGGGAHRGPITTSVCAGQHPVPALPLGPIAKIALVNQFLGGGEVHSQTNVPDKSSTQLAIFLTHY